MDEMKTVNITIAGRTFPVKVTPSEEVMVQALETELNDKIGEFQSTYPMRDKLDYVIMTMLTYTFDQKKSSSDLDMKAINSKIDKIDALLEIKD